MFWLVFVRYQTSKQAGMQAGGLWFSFLRLLDTFQPFGLLFQGIFCTYHLGQMFIRSLTITWLILIKDWSLALQFSHITVRLSDDILLFPFNKLKGWKYLKSENGKQEAECWLTCLLLTTKKKIMCEFTENCFAIFDHNQTE